MRVTFERARLRRVLLALVALKPTPLILAFDPEGLVAFQLPKSHASRAVEWPIAATLLFAFVSYGPRIVPRSRLHLFVLALLAADGLSALPASDRYLALFGDPENYAGRTFFLDMAILYLALAVAVRGERDIAVVLGAIVGPGAVALVYGAIQALGLDPFDWAVVPTSRPFATFGNPDHFGHFQSVLFALLRGLAIAARAIGTRIVGAVGALATLGVGHDALVQRAAACR